MPMAEPFGVILYCGIYALTQYTFVVMRWIVGVILYCGIYALTQYTFVVMRWIAQNHTANLM